VNTNQIVRWLLFLPAGLVIGIGLFLLFGLGGANAARYFGDDVTAPAAFAGGIIAGGASVYAAMRVAPGSNGFHHPWRSTAWEVHPVIRIEVIQ